jgi:ribonuclease D
MFGIDIETGGLALDDELRLVQISNGEDTFVIDVRESDPRPLLQEFTGDELVAHNANFEEPRLKRHLGIEYAAPIHDTMVMSQVLYAGTAKAQAMSHALDAVALRELGVELDKEQQTADWTGDITPEMYEYAKKDAEILVPLAKHLLARIEEAGLTETYELERRLRPAIHAMEQAGVAVHTDQLEDLIKESTEKANALKDELAKEWGINPGCGKQLGEHFELEARHGWPKTKGRQTEDRDQEPSVSGVMKR